MSPRLTRDDVLDVVTGALTAEYGGGQFPAARAVVQALEDEGAHHDGWTRETDTTEEKS